MAILKIKKLMEDLENNTTLVMKNPVAYAGTSLKATSAGQAGTARIAQYGSSGTGALV